MKLRACIIGFCFCIAQVWSQSAADSVSQPKFRLRQAAIPAALIAYGVVGLEDNPMRDFNRDVKRFLGASVNTDVDDVTIFLPAAAVYGLNAVGIRGKNNFLDRSILLAGTSVIMYSSVSWIKSSTGVLRPDGSTYDSFPSGHSATVFAAAEFLSQEYKHLSIWYPIAGYSVAVGTGVLRMANNRHWLTDVAAGAGIGILSTKVMYWVYPMLKKHLYSIEESALTRVIFLPASDGKSIGFAMVIGF